MDLNYLLHRHQVSLVRVDRAACGRAARAHAGLADGYARRIASARSELGAHAPMVAAR